jgi:hypothetical protein
VCETLHVHTLEGLEMAAHDGRLEEVRGFGHRRGAVVRCVLAEMLARVRRSPLVRYPRTRGRSAVGCRSGIP